MTAYKGHPGNPPRKTVHIAPGNVRAVALLDPTGDLNLLYLHTWIEHASALAYRAGKSPSPRQSCAIGGIVRRALQIYAEHLDSLPDDEARVSEFLDTSRELARQPLSAEDQERIRAVLTIREPGGALKELSATARLEIPDASVQGADAPVPDPVPPAHLPHPLPRWREVLSGKTDEQVKAEEAARAERLKAFDERLNSIPPKALQEGEGKKKVTKPAGKKATKKAR